MRLMKSQRRGYNGTQSAFADITSPRPRVRRGGMRSDAEPHRQTNPRTSALPHFRTASPRHRFCISGRVNVLTQAAEMEPMSSFSTYLVGFIILIIGLAIGAHLLGAPTMWIVVGVIILVGIGIMGATTRTRTRDPGGPPTY